MPDKENPEPWVWSGPNAVDEQRELAEIEGWDDSALSKQDSILRRQHANLPPSRWPWLSRVEPHFELVPKTHNFDELGPIIGSRGFTPVAQLPRYGMLLWALSPEHTCRFPVKRLPGPSPLWRDTEGGVAVLSGEVEALRDDLIAFKHNPLSAGYIWCVERLTADTYVELFTKRLKVMHEIKKDFDQIQKVAAELPFSGGV